MNKYRHDANLDFLRFCDNDDLGVLVEYLADSGKRLTEELTNDPRYKNSYPDHRKYWEAIAAELQHFGGNTFLNILRQEGITYKEVLCDVCDKLKVNYNNKSNVEYIEQSLFFKVLTDVFEKMTEDELRELVKDAGLKTDNYTPQAIIFTLQLAAKASGFAIYQWALIVANATAKLLLGRGLAFATNALLTRCISILIGPIGWIINATWLAVDIAGPAYRVTIPCIIQIAYMRAKLKYETQ